MNWLFSTGTSADPFNVWSVGGSILAPLFTGGRLTGQFKAADADRQLAALAYKDTVLKAFSEVENQLSAVQFLKEQAEAQNMQLNAAQKAYKHSQERYHEGYSNYIEVVDAERTLLGAQIATIQTQQSRINAAVALYQALGGGWRNNIESPSK